MKSKGVKYLCMVVTAESLQRKRLVKFEQLQYNTFYKIKLGKTRATKEFHRVWQSQGNFYRLRDAKEGGIQTPTQQSSANGANKHLPSRAPQMGRTNTYPAELRKWGIQTPTQQSSANGAYKHLPSHIAQQIGRTNVYPAELRKWGVSNIYPAKLRKWGIQTPTQQSTANGAYKHLASRALQMGRTNTYPAELRKRASNTYSAELRKWGVQTPT